MKYKILVPAYNAEKYLPELFEQIKKYDSLDNIIVINDGSADKTVKICEENNISLIDIKNNGGKGKALKRAFNEIKESDIDFFITMDADLQHAPSCLPLFIKKYEETGAGIIIGNRLHDLKDMPKSRIFSNKTTSWLLGLLCKQKILDSQCGYRLIKREVIEKINIISDKYEMESEILIKASREGYKIDFVPVPTIYGDEHSSINKVKDTYRFIRMYLRMMVY